MKQNTTLKMWVGIGAVVGATITGSQGAFALEGEGGEGGEGGETGSAEVGDVFRGKFDRALDLMFMGEGGEGGLGLSKMQPTVSVPALTGEQIEQALPGNTLAIPFHYTLHFKPNGVVGGYTVEYAEADSVDECPQPEVSGDNYLYYEGVCSTRTPISWSGKWKVEDDRLCMNVKWKNGAEEDCYYVAFLLDRVALFKSNGDLSAKGHVLKKGFQPDE